MCKLCIGNRESGLNLLKRLQLKAAGVADIAIRNDGRIFAVACWDCKIRVFSTKTCAPLAVLQVHTNLHQ